MDLLCPGEPWVNVQYLLECFDRPVGTDGERSEEGGRRPVLEIDRGHKAGLLGQDVWNKLTDYKHKIDNTQSKMQHILLVLIQVTLHVSYIDLNAHMRKRSVIIKWQHKLAIRGLICLYFCGGWNIEMQQWF